MNLCGEAGKFFCFFQQPKSGMFPACLTGNHFGFNLSGIIYQEIFL